MNVSNLVSFLQQETSLGDLSSEVLTAIANSTEERTIAAKSTLIEEQVEPEGLYIVHSGKLL
ncbi:MAG: hypothetical protein AAFR89_12725 [Cyanobacteria bacterium J06633_1]